MQKITQALSTEKHGVAAAERKDATGLHHEAEGASPGSQLAKMANDSIRDSAQRHAVDAITHSSRVSMQRKAVENIAGSRRVVAQCRATEVAQALSQSSSTNRTGLPINLKSGIEQLSGHSLDAVRVHYNSSAPAQLQALAYTQGNDIHIAPGQERHLAHESWHVVQQMEGRVAPTVQMSGQPVNDDPALEHEADVMGARALAVRDQPSIGKTATATQGAVTQRRGVIQRLAGMEVELRIPFYGNTHGVGISNTRFISPNRATVTPAERRAIVDFLYGGLQYNTSYGQVAGEYDISADHTGWRRKHRALRDHIHTLHIANPGGKPSMSNMEYRTQALEERDQASQARMQSIANHVKAHAQSSAAKATSGGRQSLDAPVGGQFTGIPVAALQKLLAADVAGLALFDEMNDALDPSLYFQTTVGTLPTEIVSVFNEGAADIEAANPGNASIHKLAKSTVLRRSVLVAQQALAHGDSAALRGLLSVGDQAALTGWLALIAQTFLARELETSSLRYTDDGAGHLHRRGGTEKNLLPYLNKTLFSNTLAALPASARPDIAGPNQAAWLAMLMRFNTLCTGVDLVNTLGLHDYNGQNYHHADGSVAGVIRNNNILSNRTPQQWLTSLLRGQPAGNAHLVSGRQLGLDAGQEHLAPGLRVPGQQAIPLEDRATQSKDSFGDETDIAHLNDTLMTAWNAAKTRRLASTTAAADYAARHAAIAGKLAAFGNLPTLLPALAQRQLRFNALPAVAPVDHTLLDRYIEAERLDAEIDVWRAALTNEALALSLLRPLLLKANWSTKGKAFIGTKVPDGISQMRTELSAGNAAAITLNNLRTIAQTRLASGARNQAVTDMYELARDTPGWTAAGGAANWNLFVVKYNTTSNAV